MSFTIQKQQFGDLTEYFIQEDSTGNRFVVIPELGAIVRQLSLRKGVTLFSVIKTPGTPDGLKEDTQSASELLFPFASRIPDGKYTFLGKPYQLHKNDGDGAIHGLVRKQNFELKDQSIGIDQASLKLGYNLRDAEGYPFSVDFTVSYTLHSNGTFVLTYEATNVGDEPCPAMFGWHPYFHLGNEDADAWKVKIPADTIVVFDEKMTPIGKEAFKNQDPILVYHTVLDNCFVVSSGENPVVTELISDNQHITLRVEQETGEGKFNHLVVYTPPGRDCVAIEPLTANVDSFNNGEGLNILAPGKTLTGSITLSLG